MRRGPNGEKRPAKVIGNAVFVARLQPSLWAAAAIPIIVALATGNLRIAIVSLPIAIMALIMHAPP